MTANAVANYLSKKVLLVTISALMDRDLTKVRTTTISTINQYHYTVRVCSNCSCSTKPRVSRTYITCSYTFNVVLSLRPLLISFVYYFKLLLKYEYNVHESFVRHSLFSVF